MGGLDKKQGHAYTVRMISFSAKAVKTAAAHAISALQIGHQTRERLLVEVETCVPAWVGDRRVEVELPSMDRLDAPDLLLDFDDEQIHLIAPGGGDLAASVRVPLA